MFIQQHECWSWFTLEIMSVQCYALLINVLLGPMVAIEGGILTSKHNLRYDYFVKCLRQFEATYWF